MGAWHTDHGILPQEILDRPLQIQAQYDHLGIRVCGLCRRELHQDSFACPFNKWQRGQICHTCVEATQLIKKPALSRHAEPISFDWFKDFKERDSRNVQTEVRLDIDRSHSLVRSFEYGLDDDHWNDWYYETQRKSDEYDPDEDSDLDRRALD